MVPRARASSSRCGAGSALSATRLAKPRLAPVARSRRTEFRDCGASTARNPSGSPSSIRVCRPPLNQGPADLRQPVGDLLRGERPGFAGGGRHDGRRPLGVRLGRGGDEGAEAVATVGQVGRGAGGDVAPRCGSSERTCRGPAGQGSANPPRVSPPTSTSTSSPRPPHRGACRRAGPSAAGAVPSGSVRAPPRVPASRTGSGPVRPPWRLAYRSRGDFAASGDGASAAGGGSGRDRTVGHACSPESNGEGRMILASDRARRCPVPGGGGGCRSRARSAARRSRARASRVMSRIPSEQVERAADEQGGHHRHQHERGDPGDHRVMLAESTAVPPAPERSSGLSERRHGLDQPGQPPAEGTTGRLRVAHPLRELSSGTVLGRGRRVLMLLLAVAGSPRGTTALCPAVAGGVDPSGRLGGRERWRSDRGRQARRHDAHDVARIRRLARHPKSVTPAPSIRWPPACWSSGSAGPPGC